MTALRQIRDATRATDLARSLFHTRRRRSCAERALEFRAVFEADDDWDEVDIEVSDEIRAMIVASIDAEIARTEAEIRALGFEPPAFDEDGAEDDAEMEAA